MVGLSRVSKWIFCTEKKSRWVITEWTKWGEFGGVEMSQTPRPIGPSRARGGESVAVADRRDDRGHAENRILKRSIIQFCDVFLFAPPNEIDNTHCG